MNANKHLTPNTPSTITNTPSTTPNTPATIGERIRALRKKRGISQQVLGDFIGVDKATVSRWENNEREPSSQDLGRMAKYFGVTKSHIFIGPEDVRPDLLDLSQLTFRQADMLRKLADLFQGN